MALGGISVSDVLFQLKYNVNIGALLIIVQTELWKHLEFFSFVTVVLFHICCIPAIISSSSFCPYRYKLWGVWNGRNVEKKTQSRQNIIFWIVYKCWEETGDCFKTSTAALEHLRTGEGRKPLLCKIRKKETERTLCWPSVCMQTMYSEGPLSCDSCSMDWRKKTEYTRCVKTLGEIFISNLGHTGQKKAVKVDRCPSCLTWPCVIIMMTLTANQSVQKNKGA